MSIDKCYYCNNKLDEETWIDDLGNYVCTTCYENAGTCKNCGCLIYDDYYKNEEYCKDCL